MSDNLPVRVCAVLEFLYTDCDPSRSFQVQRKQHSNIYRWAHCARAPQCIKNHPSFLADFETLEAELITERRIPDLRGAGSVVEISTKDLSRLQDEVEALRHENARLQGKRYIPGLGIR